MGWIPLNLSHAVLKVLANHVGQKNRITRAKLRSRVMDYLPRGEKNVSDRELRSCIEDLRRTDDQGALISSSSSGGGYWICQDMDELLASYVEERKRALNILLTVRSRLRRGRQVLSGQRKLL